LAGAAEALPIDPAVLTAHVQFIAWATRRDLDLIRKLTPEQQSRELISSFPSILATLQHLYQGNVSWFSRMRGDPIPWASIQAPKTFLELDTAWQKLLDEMTAWAKTRTAAQWRSRLSLNASQGGKRDVPLWQAIMHLSNHDSYHRGQLTTLIRQVGGTPTNTDLLFYYLDHFQG
jgi:uncharacterized damage-inducible protein DinB